MNLQHRAVRLVGAIGAGFLIVPLGATPAEAQRVPLANLLPELILREIILETPVSGLSHVAHFSPIEADEPSNPAVAVVEGFNSQIATQFSTFPLGSSTGGFTYVFDETLGTFRRGSGSFGPSFAERALTIGRRKLNAGFNYQRTSYDRFEGQDLDDGSIKFYLRHEDCCALINPGPNFQFFLRPNGTLLSPPFEGDVIEATLSLEATTHTAAMFANYGVNDRWDIGFAVPIVKVNLEASVRARILRLVTDAPPDAPITEQQRRGALNVHTFELDNPNATRTLQRSGRATGIGDIVVRTKYRLLPMAGGGVAVAVDVRLPTGDKKNLLGAGGLQSKFLLVASSERGRFGPHVNIGYTAAGGHVAGTLAGLAPTPLPDEINYSGGVELVASPRWTLTGDLVGRTLRGAGRLELASKTFRYAASDQNGFIFESPGCENSGFACASTSFEEFAPRSGNLTLLLGTGGVKYNPAGNWLISASVLFPLTNAGLRSRLTTVFGLDYAF